MIGESAVPTIAALETGLRDLTLASVKDAFQARQARDRQAVGSARCQSASIECVLPPPNVVCRSTTDSPPVPRQPAKRAGQEEPEPVGQVRPGEELAWVDVLLGALSTSNLSEVSRELGLPVAPGCDVGMGRDNRSPRRETL